MRAVKAVKAVNVIAYAAVAIIATGIFTSLDAATPAATRKWVVDYVGTNTAQSVSISNAVSQVSLDAARGMSAVMEILRTDTSTNAVQRAADAFANEIAPSVRQMVDSMIGI